MPNPLFPDLKEHDRAMQAAAAAQQPVVTPEFKRCMYKYLIADKGAGKTRWHYRAQDEFKRANKHLGTDDVRTLNDLMYPHSSAIVRMYLASSTEAQFAKDLGIANLL